MPQLRRERLILSGEIESSARCRLRDTFRFEDKTMRTCLLGAAPVVRVRMESGGEMAQHAGDEQLKNEFNQWAEQGRGEEMEKHHISIAEQTIALMGLKEGDRVLDLGCG